jgi:hypothetical protein
MTKWKTLTIGAIPLRSIIGKPRWGTLYNLYQSSTINGVVVLLKRAKHGNAI